MPHNLYVLRLPLPPIEDSNSIHGMRRVEHFSGTYGELLPTFKFLRQHKDVLFLELLNDNGEVLEQHDAIEY
jgi:hypothetical protein